MHIIEASWQRFSLYCNVSHKELMDFNFKKRYSTYSNADLLRMLDMPQNYRPEAIAAVTELLATREITEADHKAAHPEQLLEFPYSASTENRQSSIFDDEALPARSQQFENRKWMIIVLLSLPYLSQLYLVLHWIYIAITHAYMVSSPMIFAVQLLILAAVGTVLYLLAKVHRLGYLLTGCLALYMTAAYAVSLLTDLNSETGKLAVLYLALVSGSAAIVYQLNNPEFYSYYIDDAAFRKFRLRAALLTIALFMVVCFFKFVVEAGRSF